MARHPLGVAYPWCSYGFLLFGLVFLSVTDFHFYFHGLVTTPTRTFSSVCAVYHGLNGILQALPYGLKNSKDIDKKEKDI
jgi:hypothetical protein